MAAISLCPGCFSLGQPLLLQTGPTALRPAGQPASAPHPPTPQSCIVFISCNPQLPCHNIIPRCSGRWSAGRVVQQAASGLGSMVLSNFSSQSLQAPAGASEQVRGDCPRNARPAFPRGLCVQRGGPTWKSLCKESYTPSKGSGGGVGTTL